MFSVLDFQINRLLIEFIMDVRLEDEIIEEECYVWLIEVIN